MSFATDKGYSVKHFAVQNSLAAKPPKTVPIRFDFVPMKLTVYYRDVYLGTPLADS